ncbi:MAG TPA: YjgP/YjgQ family permease, partial [Saprospirales bacterium]|nr:YjgP/YjgQ family permease [Saprospirales bacterium]
MEKADGKKTGHQIINYSASILKRLDIYIIQKYLGTFFFSMLLITMVAIVIDFPERIDHFINESVTFKEILFDYYLNFIPWINAILWPLFALIAVIFFTSRLAKDTEFVAMLSSGISYYRLLLPYLAGALVIASLHWTGNNYIVPKSTRIKAEFENKYIYKANQKVDSDNVQFMLDPQSIAFLRYYRYRDTSAIDFRIETYDGQKMVKYLSAQRIKFKKEPNIWTIEDYYIRTISGKREMLKVKRGESLDTMLNLVPKDFVRYKNQREMMTSSEMRELIKYERQKGISTANNLVVELQRRNADSVTILILTIIGFAIASRKSREGTGLNLALGAGIGAIFVVTSRFAIAFSNSLAIDRSEER